MKYVIGAGIGGLFGFSLPMVVDIQSTNINNESPRIEDSQPVNPMLPVPIEERLILPDNICGYIDFDSEDIKEQAKECMSKSRPAI